MPDRVSGGGAARATATRCRTDHAEAGDHQCPARGFGNGAGNLGAIPGDVVDVDHAAGGAEICSPSNVFDEDGLTEKVEPGRLEVVPARRIRFRLHVDIAVRRADEVLRSNDRAVKAHGRDVLVLVQHPDRRLIFREADVPRGRNREQAVQVRRRHTGRPDVGVANARRAERIGRKRCRDNRICRNGRCRRGECNTNDH